VHPLLASRIYKDFLGVDDMSIHSEAENEALIELAEQLDLPGLNPSVHLSVRHRAHLGWHWANGRPVDFAPFDKTPSRKTLNLGERWTKESGWERQKLISWPADGPPRRSPETFVLHWYPLHTTHDIGNRRYALIDHAVTRAGAEAVARSYGAELASLDNKAEIDLAVRWSRALQRTSSPRLWHAKGMIVDGRKMPNPDDTEARMLFLLEWADADKVPRFQAKGKDMWDRVLGVDRIRRSFGNSEYLLVRREQNWFMASGIADHFGLQLAEINSTEEATFLKENIPYKLWIGGNDLKKEGTWTWCSGAEWDAEVAEWFGDEPDNFQGLEDCLLHISRKGLSDCNCLEHEYYLLERQRL